MSTEVERLVIDRFEGTVAVLVSDDGTSIDVDRALLPKGAGAGDVLRVNVGPQGGFRWSEAVVDVRATAERVMEGEDILGGLRKRDPGGDVVL